MNKVKKLQLEIEELKNRIIELQAQVITLQLSRGVIITTPQPITTLGIQPSAPLPPWSPN